MPVLVVGGIKGGSGKTTIASNLAVLRSKKKKRVLLIDADEQRSMSDWAEHRESLSISTPWTTISLLGAAVRSQIQKMIKDYDDIIVDTGGRDTTSQRSALTVADIFLAPFQPRSLDVWTMDSVSSLISEIKTVNPKLQAFALLNRCDAIGNDNADAAAILQECSEITYLPTSLFQRKAFANAISDGLGVIELKKPNKKATAEVEALCQALFGKQ